MDISFKDFIAISEGKQVGKLYHFTGVGNLAIMLDDGFDMKSNNNYVSFTRDYNLIDDTRRNQLQQNYKLGNKQVARITVDGDKMSNYYKIEPFMDVRGNVTYKNSESEERVVLKKDINLEKFIVQIDIIYEDWDLKNLINELSKTKLYNKFNFNYVKNVKHLKKIK